MRTLRPKGDKIIGGWNKLQNKELANLYSSPSIIRMIRLRRLKWAGHVALKGKKRNACTILVGKTEGKKPLGRPRCGWEDNIKTNLREIGWGDMDWIHLAHDRHQWRAIVNMVMKIWFS
jgi:hypothetical protein